MSYKVYLLLRVNIYYEEVPPKLTYFMHVSSYYKNWLFRPNLSKKCFQTYF